MDNFDLKKYLTEGRLLEDNANISLSDLEEMGYDAGEKAFDMHFDKSILKNSPDTKSYKKGFLQAIIDSAKSLNLEENNTINEGEEETVDITLSDGETYNAYIDSYKLFTSDKTNRYSIYINTPDLSEDDVYKLLDLVSSNDPTLVIRDKKVKDQQTELVIASNDEKIHSYA